MRLSLALLAVALLTPAVHAAPAHVTVVNKESRSSGTLSAEQIEIIPEKGPAGRLPLADVAMIQFGDTIDVIRTKNGRRVKGIVKVDGWTLKGTDGDKPVARGDVRFLIPQAPIGPPRKGVTVDAATANGMTYHVRVPPKYDPKTGAPAIVFFHGSNSYSADYLVGIDQRWPKVAADYVLIGIDGEWPVQQKNPDAPPAHNYTYVNFVGKSKYKGFPGSDRESPALVAEAIAEIREQLKLTKIFVTGHSQGGFLSYSCLMNYPEIFDGAMPIAGGLIMQAEPTAYEDAALRAQQRKRPLAILHGSKDPVVPLSMSTAAYGSFLDDGFPMLRLMVAKDAGHQFIAMPFEEGIRWMESMASDDPKALATSADKAFARKDYRDALAYLMRAQDLDPEGKQAGPARTALRQKLEQLAAAPAKTLDEKLRKPDSAAWVPEFDAFRQHFEFTDAAKPVMGQYAALRKEQEEPGAKAWAEVRKAFQENRKDEGYRLCEQIVQKYPATAYYRYAKQTLAERK